MAGTFRNIRVKIFRNVFIGVLILNSVESFGQDADTRKEGKHFIGMKAGQNLSWLHLDPRVRQKVVNGRILGVSYNYMAQYFGGIMIEAQYIEYGWKEVFPDTISSYSRKLDYLELPVMSNFIIGKKNTHLKFQGGFKIAMILDDKEMSDLAKNRIRYYNGHEIEDIFELGLAFGTSLSQVFSFGEFQLDARFNTTLSNLFEAPDNLSLIYSQNQGISFSIYYWIKLK